MKAYPSPSILKDSPNVHPLISHEYIANLGSAAVQGGDAWLPLYMSTDAEMSSLPGGGGVQGLYLMVTVFMFVKLPYLTPRLHHWMT